LHEEQRPEELVHRAEEGGNQTNGAKPGKEQRKHETKTRAGSHAQNRKRYRIGDAAGLDHQ
jgi:hypothetical protein